MFIKESTLDDLMHNILEKLLVLPCDVTPSKGRNSEIFGVLLELTNPRARLSISETRGKAFSTLGEFLWYMSKSNSLDFIEYYISEYKTYSDDGTSIYGGYGPRLFNMHGEHNQIENIINLLKHNRDSRKAVIQLFDAVDIVDKHGDIPCTCSLQFAIRKGKLNLFVTMRSNDAFWGFPHDVFCFTMLQEMIALDLKVEVGTYFHSVASLHLYEKHHQEAQKYIDEGWFHSSNDLVMPQMPSENVWSNLDKLLKIENDIRHDRETDISKYDLPSYWKDLAHLLKIFKFQKKGDLKNMALEQTYIKSPIYKSYIEKKLKIV